MNLYLISQTENDGYEIYDSAVVAAESEEDAKRIHPGGCVLEKGRWTSNPDSWTWASSPKNVKAELIGMAAPFTKQGVILASFNAG